ncbi:MAG: bifunctional folylpolyglutamate synthase/dihydrofolate synthase [Candidatus Berkiellales bacterium]
MISNRDLSDWLLAISHRHPTEIDLGLSRIKAVATRSKVLDFSYKVVTVGGTNGKGSTVATLATLLFKAGLNVGTYTSPHLLHFNERIQINGDPVPDHLLCESFAKIEASLRSISLTYFEFITLVAFDVFQKANPALDVVILEVGMGGRLDAVNVVDPNMAIISSISYDHQAWLGNTLEDIALEKAGIFRHQLPVILSDAAAKISALTLQAKKLNCNILCEGSDFGYDKDHSQWVEHQNVIDLPAFNLPPRSVSSALAAYQWLAQNTFSLASLQTIVTSLHHKMMMGRAHIIYLEGKMVILDVAHNPEGSQWLSERLLHLGVGKNISAVWSSLSDKSFSEIIEPMKSLVKTWYIGQLEAVPRATPVSLLHEALLHSGVKQIASFDNIYHAFQAALNSAAQCIVVFGSFYTVSQVLEQMVPFSIPPRCFGLYTARI